MEIKTQDQLDAAIAATPGEKVTPDYMRSRIKGHTFHRLDGTLIVCVITLDNGYTVTGQSACADPVNFSEAIGQKIAFDNAFNALWPLFGFLLSERRHQSGLPSVNGVELDEMTNRFLAWKLPADFAPDGGVARTESFSEHTSGTNVLNYDQAREMLRHVVSECPAATDKDMSAFTANIMAEAQQRFSFGVAIDLLREGKRVAREGWNGKGMWLSLSCDGSRSIPSESFWSPHNRAHAEAQGGHATVLPSITMKTATGEILMGWLASQTDMLAMDWQVV